MLLNSAISGVGILLVLPLLSAVGITIDGVGNNGIGERIAGFFASVGVPLALGSMLVIYCILILVTALLAYWQAILGARLTKQYVSTVRAKVYRGLFYAEWHYLSRQHMADFIRLTTGQVNTLGVCVQRLLTLSKALVLVAVLIAVSFLVSPALTLLAVISSVSLVLILWPVNKLMRKSGSAQLVASRQLFRSTVGLLSNLKVIKSFTAEPQFLNITLDSAEALDKQQILATHYNSLTRAVNISIVAIVVALLFYVALQFLDVPLTNLMILLLIFTRLLPQVQGIQSSVQGLSQLAPMLGDLQSRLIEIERQQEPLGTLSSFKSMTDGIEFNELGYQYPEADNPVFSGLSGSVKPKQSVAFTGVSGSGKSTLADIVAGLITPTSGSFTLDRVSIDESNRYQWRKKVAYVSQDILLFHDSIRVNLEWVVDHKVDDEELWQALKLAAAEDFVRVLPRGLDTVIGDRGVRLSGGERQRLALARALLNKPEVLVLDEATSALDRGNEQKIRDALIGLDGTMMIVVIAHDEATIAHIKNRINVESFG
jgi:ATP-binding cassette subfamily C protein